MGNEEIEKIATLIARVSECEFVVRRYRRLGSSAGNRAWREYKAKYEPPGAPAPADNIATKDYVDKRTQPW